MSGQGVPSFKMDTKIWEDFLSYLEQAQRSQLNNIIGSEAAAIDLEAQNVPSTASTSCNTKAAEATHLLELCRLDEQKGVVVLSSDSESDDDTIWSNNAKCKGYRRLWEMARCLAFHRLIPSFYHCKNSARESFFYKTTEEQLFPYNKLKELAEELRKFQHDFVHNQEELDFLWNNVVQWLLALKHSMDPMDLKYDEKLNLILIDFMVQYINYMTQKSCKIAMESEVYEKVNKIVHTLGVILSGNALHAIMVLLRIELKLEYRTLLDPIFRKYLTDRCLCQAGTDLVFYLRVIFCFKRWKMITPLKADREAINNLAVGKSLRKLRDKCANDVHDLTMDSILPKSVPKVNAKNKFFISISDLIGFAIERKAIGTRILLVYTSLDLDDAISKYLRFYERYVSSYPDSHTANISAFAVRETLLPQTMDVTSVTKRISKDATPCQPHRHREKEQQNAAQPPFSEYQLNCSSTHFNSNCDKNKTRLSYSPSCNVSTFSRKNTNTESDISLSSLHNSFNNNLETIRIDLTDSDENDNSKSSKSPPIRNFSPQLELKTSKAQMTYSRRHRNKGQLENNNITTELKTYSSEQNSTITLTLSSSSSDDENSLVNYLKKSDSDAVSRQNIVLNENAVGFEQSIPRIAAVPPRCRPLVESVATKPTRKEKHCIPGEVSSTTSPDCILQTTNALRTPATPEQASTSSTFQYNNISNLEVHSAGILQNAREVGIVKAVQQRVSPCPPVVVSGTCKPGSLLLGIDYSDVSSESEDRDSNCEPHLMSRGSWKVVEEATSSTVEFPKNFTENIVVAIRNERTRAKSKMSPSGQISEAENNKFPTHQPAPLGALDECHIHIDEPICSKNIRDNHTKQQTAALTSVQKCPLKNASRIKENLGEPIVTNSSVKSAQKNLGLKNSIENKNINIENITENSECKNLFTKRKESELSLLDHTNSDKNSISDQLTAENSLILRDKSPNNKPSENSIKETEAIPANFVNNENQLEILFSQHKESASEEGGENNFEALSTPSGESISEENEEGNDSNNTSTLEKSNITMHCVVPSPASCFDKKTLHSGLEDTLNEKNTNCKDVDITIGLTTKEVSTTVKTNSLNQCDGLMNELQTKHLVINNKTSNINMLLKDQSKNEIESTEAADIESFLKEIDDNLKETVSSAISGQKKIKEKEKIVENTSENDGVKCKINELISKKTENTEYVGKLNDNKQIKSTSINIDTEEVLKLSKKTVSCKEKTNEIIATKDKNKIEEPVSISNILLKLTKSGEQNRDSYVSKDNKSSTSTCEKLGINAKTDFSLTEESNKTHGKNNKCVQEDHKMEVVKDSGISSLDSINYIKNNNQTVKVVADMVKDNAEIDEPMSDTSINAYKIPNNMLEGKGNDQQTVKYQINIVNTNENEKVFPANASSLDNVNDKAKRLSPIKAVIDKISSEDSSHEKIKIKEAQNMEICQETGTHEQKKIHQQTIIDQSSKVTTNENKELLTANASSLASFDVKAKRLSSIETVMDKISLGDDSEETIKSIKKICQDDSNEKKTGLDIDTIDRNEMTLGSSKKQIKALDIKGHIDDVLIEMANLVLSENDINAFVGNNKIAEKSKPTLEITNENKPEIKNSEPNKNKVIFSVENKSNVNQRADDITMIKAIDDNSKQLKNLELVNSQSNDLKSDTLVSTIKAKEMQESHRNTTTISINETNVPAIQLHIFEKDTNIDNIKDDTQGLLENEIKNLQSLSLSQSIETDRPENVILEIENDKSSEKVAIVENISHYKHDQTQSVEMKPLSMDVNTTCEHYKATEKSSVKKSTLKDILSKDLIEPTQKRTNESHAAENCTRETTHISFDSESENNTHFQEKLSKDYQKDSHALEENDIKELVKKKEDKIHATKYPEVSITQESKDNDLILGGTSKILSFQIGSNKGDEIVDNITTTETMNKSSNLSQLSDDFLLPASTESLNSKNITVENIINESKDIGHKENSTEIVTVEKIHCLEPKEMESNIKYGDATLLCSNSTLKSTQEVVETETNTSEVNLMCTADSTISDKNKVVAKITEVNSRKTVDSMQLNSSMTSENHNLEGRCEIELTEKRQPNLSAKDLKDVEFKEVQKPNVENKTNVARIDERTNFSLDAVYEQTKSCKCETPLNVGKEKSADSNNFDNTETMVSNVFKDLKEDSLTLIKPNTIAEAQNSNVDKETILCKPRNCVSVTVANKHRYFLYTDDEKRTPWKMRIKRRISQCSDINKEFNLDSDEDEKTEDLCNNLFVSADNNLLPSPLASPNVATAADELAANISKLDIKRKSTSSESDHSNVDIDCVDFQGSWLRNLGLLKNTSRSHVSPAVGSNEKKCNLNNFEEDSPTEKVSTKFNSEELVAITALVDMQNKCSNKNDSNEPDKKDTMQNLKIAVKGRRGRPSKSKLTPISCSLKNTQSNDAIKPLKTILKSKSYSRTNIKKKVTYDEASILALEKNIESRKAKKEFEKFKINHYEEGSLLKGNNKYTKKRLAKINLRFKLESHQRDDEQVDCNEIENLKETTLAVTPVPTDIPKCLPERKELESTVFRLMERVQNHTSNKLPTINNSNSDDIALAETQCQNTDEVIKPRRGRKRKIDKISTLDIRNKPSIVKNIPDSKKFFVKKNTEQEDKAKIIYPVLLTSGKVGDKVTEKCKELPLTTCSVEPQTTSCERKPLKNHKKQSNKSHAIVKDQLIVPDEINLIKSSNNNKTINSEMELKKCSLGEVKQNTYSENSISIKKKQTAESHEVHLKSQSLMKKAFVRLKRIELPNQSTNSSTTEQIHILSTNSLIQESEIKKEPIEEIVTTNTSSIDISIKIKEESTDECELDLQYSDLTETKSNGNSNKSQCKEIIVRPCDVILTADIINAQATHLTEIAKNRKNLRNRNTTSRQDSPILTKNIEKKDMSCSTPTSKRQETVPALAEHEKNKIFTHDHKSKNKNINLSVSSKNISDNIKKKTMTRKDIEATEPLGDTINVPEGENNLQLSNDPKCISTEKSIKNSPELSKECEKNSSKANQRRKNNNRIEVPPIPQLGKNVQDRESNKQLANVSKCVSTEKSIESIPELLKECDKNQKMTNEGHGRKNKGMEVPQTPGDKINVPDGKSHKQLPIDSKCVSTEKTIQTKECGKNKKLSKSNQDLKNINSVTSSEKLIQNKNNELCLKMDTSSRANQKEANSSSVAENNKLSKSSKDILTSCKTVKPDIKIKHILSTTKEKDIKICKLNLEINEKAAEDPDRHSELKKKANDTFKVEKAISKQKSERKSVPDELSRIETKTKCEKKPAKANQEADLHPDLKNKDKSESLIVYSNQKKESRLEKNISLKETQTDENIVSDEESTKGLPVKETCAVGMEVDSKSKKLCNLNQDSNAKHIKKTDEEYDLENRVQEFLEEHKVSKDAEKNTVPDEPSKKVSTSINKQKTTLENKGDKFNQKLANKNSRGLVEEVCPKNKNKLLRDENIAFEKASNKQISDILQDKCIKEEGVIKTKNVAKSANKNKPKDEQKIDDTASKSDKETDIETNNILTSANTILRKVDRTFNVKAIEKICMDVKVIQTPQDEKNVSNEEGNLKVARTEKEKNKKECKFGQDHKNKQIEKTVNEDIKGKQTSETLKEEYNISKEDMSMDMKVIQTPQDQKNVCNEEGNLKVARTENEKNRKECKFGQDLKNKQIEKTVNEDKKGKQTTETLKEEYNISKQDMSMDMKVIQTPQDEKNVSNEEGSFNLAGMEKEKNGKERKLSQDHKDKQKEKTVNEDKKGKQTTETLKEEYNISKQDMSMDLKIIQTPQDEKNVSNEEGNLEVGRTEKEKNGKECKFGQNHKNKQIEKTVNETLKDEYNISKEDNDLKLRTDDSFTTVSKITDKQKSLKKNKENELDQNLNNKTSSALLLGNDNANTENHKKEKVVNEEKNIKIFSKTLIEQTITSTTTAEGRSNQDLKHTETVVENINKEFYLEKEDKVDTVSGMRVISCEKDFKNSYSLKEETYFKEKEAMEKLEKAVTEPKNVSDCSKNVRPEEGGACNVTHQAILGQTDENITDCVIAELKLLSPQNILLQQDNIDLDPDVEIAKKLDQGIEMVLGSKNENKSREQNGKKTNVAVDKEQKTAELLDSAIEKVLGNYLPSDKTNKLQEATLDEVSKQSYKPKTTTEHLDFAIDAILGPKKSPKHVKEADADEKKNISPAKRKLGVLTAEKINSSLEKLLENNRKNDLEHKTAETLNQSIEKILGKRISSVQNVESKTAPVATSDISPKKHLSSTDEPHTKKAMNKKYFTDMKIVSAIVPEALFADDDSDNSNSEEATSPDNLKFFTPILSLDDLLNKKTDQLLQIPTCTEGNDFSCEQENADESQETRQCLGTPNFSTELEIETSKKSKKIHSEENTNDVTKNANNISVTAEDDHKKLPNSLEETNATNLENFVLSSISDIPIDFNMSNESFPDVMDIMLLDQVQQSIDCVISGNNFAQKWSQNNYTSHGSLQNQIEKSKNQEIVPLITPTTEHSICISQILDSNKTVANASCPTSIDIGQEILYSSINPLDEVEVSTNIGFDLVGNVTVEDLLANDGDDLFAFSELDKTRSRSNSFSTDSENCSGEETGNIAQTTKAIACDHSYNKEIKATDADKSTINLTNFPKPVIIEGQNNPTPTKTKSAIKNKSPHYNFTKLKSHPTPYWKVRKVDDVKTSTPKRDSSIEEQGHDSIVKNAFDNAADLSNIKLEQNLAKKNLFYNMPELDIGASKLSVSNTTDCKGISIISSTTKQAESVGNSAIITTPTKQLDSVDIYSATSFDMPSSMELESSVDIHTSIRSEDIPPANQEASVDVHKSIPSEIIERGKQIISVDVNSRISSETIASSNQIKSANMFQNISSALNVYPKQIETFDILPSKLSATANQVESGDVINTVSEVVASANEKDFPTETSDVYQVELINIQSRRSSEISSSAKQEQSDSVDTTLPSEVLAPITQVDLIGLHESNSSAISSPTTEVQTLDLNPSTSTPSTDQESINITAMVPKKVRLEITEMITIVAPSPISHETVSTTFPTASEPNSPNQQEKTSSRSSTPIEITEVITIPAHSIIAQPIITIQSQTNRLQRIDPVPNQDQERHDYTQQTLGCNSTPLCSHREPTPTLDELTKDEEEETTFERQQLNNDLSRDKSLKRANTPTLDEPPEKKPFLDEGSKTLPLNNLFDMLKQETPVNHAVCKKLFKKIDTSEESDETPQCDTLPTKHVESKVENSKIKPQQSLNENIEIRFESKCENPEPTMKPTQNPVVKTIDTNSFQKTTIESSSKVWKNTLKDSVVNIKGNEELLVKKDLPSTTLQNSSTSNKYNLLISTNSKPKSISDLPKIAKIKEKPTENPLDITITVKDKVSTEPAQFNKASINCKKTTLISPPAKNTTSPSTSKSAEVNNRTHPQHHSPDDPKINRNKYSYQRGINSSEASKLNSVPKSIAHKPSVKSIFEQKQNQHLTNSVYKCVPSMPNTQRSTAPTSSINAANIKLSAADEAELKAKLGAYQKTLPATKIYKEHREQLRLLKLQEEKLRLEYLEREKRRQAEKLKVEAAQRLKRKSQNDSFESHYKRFALSSGSRASSSQSQSSQIQQHSHHSQQKPHHSHQQSHRPANTTRQAYVNKFGEIEKKIASSRGCKETAPSKAPLTITTAWEHKSTSVDEIIEHLAKMKKP